MSLKAFEEPDVAPLSSLFRSERIHTMDVGSNKVAVVAENLFPSAGIMKLDASQRELDVWS